MVCGVSILRPNATKTLALLNSTLWENPHPPCHPLCQHRSSRCGTYMWGKAGKVPVTNNLSVFSTLTFSARVGDVECLKIVLSSAEHRQKWDQFEKVMLRFALEIDNRNTEACHGDLEAVRLLTSKGYDINIPDRDGYTPPMPAAREGHGHQCELLILHGAQWNVKNSKAHIALSLARRNFGRRNEAECVILDELSRKLVLRAAIYRSTHRELITSSECWEVMVSYNGQIQPAKCDLQGG
ncbi:hypothetical protein Ancab_002672 [Ancistrocladus abbreviatus]